MAKKKFSWIDFLPVTFTSVLLISQIIIGIYLLPNVTQIEILAYTGVGIYVFSGWIFGMLPIVEFRRKGRVKKGKSYVQTNKLVDTGLYSIIRHPQFTTWMIWAIAGMLIFQHWIVVLLGIPIIPLTYTDLIKADERLVKKFGVKYKKYMQKVPRANFLLGIFRVSRNKTIKK